MADAPMPPRRMRQLPPVVLALLLQLLAFVLLTFALRLLTLPCTPFGFAIACGVLAAGFSHLARQARWWLPIQLLFVPALVLTLHVGIPPFAFLLAFVLMILLYWSTFCTQVPLYFSSHKVWQVLASQLPINQPFHFVDLGSGIGGVLTYLSRTHPPARHISRCGNRPLAFCMELVAHQVGGGIATAGCTGAACGIAIFQNMM